MHKLLEYLQAYFLPSSKLRVYFNRNMSPDSRHAVVWCMSKDGFLSAVGITLNYPKVLTFMHNRHLVEIKRQTIDCGYDPVYIAANFTLKGGYNEYV